MELDGPIIMRNVVGSTGLFNDVIYHSPSIKRDITSAIDQSIDSGTCAVQRAVIFFGGDTQDFTANMEAHRDNNRYKAWSLENVAQLLKNKFPERHIVVIRALRMQYGTFACYANFVPSGNGGVPQHTANYGSLQHFGQLLSSISLQLDVLASGELGGEVTNRFHIDKLPLTVVGFSKGCAVLNQFLYEFHHLETSTPYGQLNCYPKFEEMIWLDGGHSGGKNTWITSKFLLDSFAKLGIRVQVHVTPYQIDDDRRPWIKHEEKQFSDYLSKLRVPVKRVVHFVDQEPTLMLHFEVLNMFDVST